PFDVPHQLLLDVVASPQQSLIYAMRCDHVREIPAGGLIQQPGPECLGTHDTIIDTLQHAVQVPRLPAGGASELAHYCVSQPCTHVAPLTYGHAQQREKAHALE